MAIVQHKVRNKVTGNHFNHFFFAVQYCKLVNYPHKITGMGNSYFFFSIRFTHFVQLGKYQ